MSLESGVEVVFPPAPKSHDTWYGYCVPEAGRAFDHRWRYPRAWWGLRNEALRSLTEVPGALFCDRDGHLVGAGTRAGVEALLALAHGVRPC